MPTPKETDAPEQEAPEEEQPSVVENGCEGTGRVEEDNESTPVFENDGPRSSGERTQAVTTRFARKRTGSFRSIRKRLSVQRRSTFGIGDSRPDDEHVNEQSPKVSGGGGGVGGDDEAEKEKAKKKTAFFKRKPKKEKVDRRSSEPLAQIDKVDVRPVKRHSENRIGQGQGKAVACATLRRNSNVTRGPPWPPYLASLGDLKISLQIYI